MKHAQNKPGSMVLSCIFFMSIVMLIILMQWKSQEALQNIVIMRMESIKKEYAAQTLLDYGIELCTQQYPLIVDKLLKHKVSLSLTFNRWPVGCRKEMQGTLEISYNKQLILKATLSDQNVAQIAFVCHLEKQTIQNKQVYMITAWQRHEV
jgi:hypothetical protein